MTRRPAIRMGVRSAIGIALLAVCLPTHSEETVKKLEVGDPAPQFTLAGSDGETHSLEDHTGKRPVVIAWFPKAFTGG